MNHATISIRAHFDGKVIVPDEPVDLPVDAALDVEVRPHRAARPASETTVALRLAALQQFQMRIRTRHGTPIPAEMLRREQMYGDDGR